MILTTVLRPMVQVWTKICLNNNHNIMSIKIRTPVNKLIPNKAKIVTMNRAMKILDPNLRVLIKANKVLRRIFRINSQLNFKIFFRGFLETNLFHPFNNWWTQYKIKDKVKTNNIRNLSLSIKMEPSQG